MRDLKVVCQLRVIDPCNWEGDLIYLASVEGLPFVPRHHRKNPTFMRVDIELRICSCMFSNPWAIKH